MSDGNGSEDRTPISYNIIKSRGSPTEAVTLSGHRVEKKDFVIMPNPMDSEGYGSKPMALMCADYHNEHFVYIDPLFEKDLPKDDRRQIWFAMCTCGSPAGMIGPGDAARHNGQQYDGSQGKLLVCQAYYQNLLMHGHGYHVGQDPRAWR